jgi:hypothetical protein
MSDNVQSTGSGFGREIAPSGYSGLSDSSRALGGTAQALQPDGGAQIQKQAPPVSGGPGAGSGEGEPQAPIGSDQRQQSVRGAHNQNQAQASSGSPSAGGGEGTAQAPNESATQGGNFMAQRILAECELVVGHYRHRRISKGRALHEIHEKLTVAAAGSSLGVESSFNSFLAALEDCDKQDSGAANRGRALASAQGLEGGPSDANRESSPPALERPGGRSNALEGQYPWVVTEIIESALQPLSPNLTETLRLLKIFLQDPKGAKHSILTSARCPEFPDSEWTNLVNGRPVNLGAVLSGLFSTTTNDERFEILGGGLELRFGAVAPTKLVSDAGTWTIAFDKMRAATLFAFPHRARELGNYRDYIVGLFAASHSSFHDRIISFDKAVRKRVAQRRDVELTDFHQFMDIKTAVVDPIGVGVVTAQRESNAGAARRPKTEACNNWNIGRCTADVGNCRRLHICNNCRVAGHKGPDCPERSKI